MIKKQKGFTLAEVLITLLVVGIVGAAAIPTMTKRSTGTDKMWEWADYPVGSAYSLGTHVLLDKDSNEVPQPELDGATNRLGYYLPFHSLDTHKEKTDMGKNTVPAQDKLILFNNFDVTSNSFAKPHISLYNQYTARGNKYIEYAGSLTSDKYNLALGAGALQSLLPNGQTVGAFNTAMGHYALLSNIKGNNNTAFGSNSLISLGYNTENAGSYNVAIGAESQKNNKDGSYNTSVGSESLTAIGVEQANNNIALGNQALKTESPTDKFFQSNNIAIGAKAGYNRGLNETDPTSDNANRLFIGQENFETNDSDKILPFIEAKMTNDGSASSPNPFFNINADELIVNTADGKHTILKIRMIDDDGVDLPKIGDKGYQALNYCKGEGSEDVKKSDSDPTALAEVCIAKFKDQSIVVPAYSTAPTAAGRTWIDFDRIIKGGLGGLNSHDNVTDWDIYLRGLDIGFDGGISTGLNAHAHIQTVKASLNYLERFKESSGWFGMASSAFMHNLKCAFSYFFGDCGEFIPGPQRNFVDEVKSFFEALSTKLWEKIKPSDKRLKDVSGESTAGLKEIRALKIKNYTYKADKAKTPHVGVIAQELQNVFPNSVFEGADGYLKIKQEEMFFAMVNAIQELDDKEKQHIKEIPKVNKQIKSSVEQNKKLLTENEKLKLENEKLMAQLKELNDK